MKEEQPGSPVLATDLVERYLQRRMSDEEEAAFEEYLLLHPAAAQAVADAERLQRGLRRWEEEGGALGTAAASPAPAPAAAPPAGWRRFATLRRLAPYAALAALLAAALMLPSALSRRGEPRPAPAPPAQGPSFVTLSPLRGGPGGAGGLPLLRLGDPAELIYFALEKTRGVPGPYRVRLLQAGREVWRQEGLAAASEGPLMLAVEARLLPPGPAEFLAESQADPPQEVGRFSLEIAAPP